MNLKTIFLIFINLIIIAMFSIYMFNPGGELEFKFIQNTNGNFTIQNQTSIIQFYPQMRFPSKNISYNIDKDCSLKKKNSVENGFKKLGNITDLYFYQVPKNEEITVYCSEKVKFENRMFIAGEGGPTNITDGGKYRVILHGSILLIKDSGCNVPIVSMHEMLHVLGFNHSKNKNNILYPVAKCSQIIGDDLIKKINELYKENTYADLLFENSQAEIKGRYLNINLSIRNDGLKKSKNATIKIYNKKKIVKEIPISPLDIGYGIKINIKNIWLTSVKTEKIKVLISTSSNELSLDNNLIILNKKNN